MLISSLTFTFNSLLLVLLNNSGFVSSQNNDNNNNSQVKEEIKIENLYFELNDDENTYQKL